MKRAIEKKTAAAAAAGARESIDPIDLRTSSPFFEKRTSSPDAYV
jgi:hypothetical protein